MRVNYNSYNKKEDDNYGYEAPNMGAPIANKMKYPNEDFDPNVDYTQRQNDAVYRGDFIGGAKAERQKHNKIESGFGGIYQPTYELNYNSKYGDKIASLRDNRENYKDFKYDPMKDEAYHALTRVYGANAERASADALGRAAAANGGRLSSHAVIAADLAYQDKMGQLEAEIPQLREAAYNMYLNEKNDKRNLMNDYINAENENYSRWVDNYNRMYQNARDLIADNQQREELDYRRATDLRDFNEDVRRYNQDFAEDVRRDARDYDEDVRRWEDEYEATYEGRKASGGSSGSRKGSDPSVGQPNNDATVGINTQSAYNKAIKGATPAQRQQIALDMLTNGEITVTQYQEILSKIAG